MTGRSRETKLEAEHGGPQEQRVGHVVAVADVPDHRVLQLDALGDGLQVGHDLARVQEVGEAVHDRYRGALGKLQYLLVAERADHDAVDVAAEHTGRVRHAFASSHLGVPVREEEGMTAQLGHAGLKAHPRTGGALPENHRQGLPLEGSS